MDQLGPILYDTLYRPAPSPDNEVVAIVSPDERLVVLDTRSGSLVADISLPVPVRKALSELQSVSWSAKTLVSIEDNPQSKDKVRRRILFTFSNRLVVAVIDLSHTGNPNEAKYSTRLDYKLETHAGKISLAKFVLNSQYILVLFETSTHAVLVETSGTKRVELPLAKFVGQQGIAENPLRNALAVMVRAQGQDHIIVFTVSGDEMKEMINFTCKLSDAQGLTWSPDGDPVLAIWDSAAYGIRVKFFSGLGHQLQQLAIDDNTFGPHAILDSLAGLGVCKISWTTSAVHDTLLAIGNGHGNIFVRAQQNTHLTSSLVLQLKHHSMVDGSEYIIWQESENHSFVQQELAIDLQYDQDTTIEILQWNSSSTLLASSIKTFPRAVWVWRTTNNCPLTLLIFEHDIKQIAWHPSNPSILIIITNCKQPLFFCWHDVQLPPQAIALVHTDITPSSQWRATWLQTGEDQRAPLMIANTKHYTIGLLHRESDTVVFESILGNQMIHDIEETEMFDTPSKPGRNAAEIGKPMVSNAVGKSSEILW